MNSPRSGFDVGVLDPKRVHGSRGDRSNDPTSSHRGFSAGLFGLRDHWRPPSSAGWWRLDYLHLSQCPQSWDSHGRERCKCFGPSAFIPSPPAARMQPGVAGGVGSERQQGVVRLLAPTAAKAALGRRAHGVTDQSKAAEPRSHLPWQGGTACPKSRRAGPTRCRRQAHGRCWPR